MAGDYNGYVYGLNPTNFGLESKKKKSFSNNDENGTEWEKQGIWLAFSLRKKKYLKNKICIFSLSMHGLMMEFVVDILFGTRSVEKIWIVNVLTPLNSAPFT